nr:hypothetical protein [Tanacetum cinerariifolium]
HRRHRRRRGAPAVQTLGRGRQAAALGIQHRQQQPGASAGLHPHAGRRDRRQGRARLPADAAGRRAGHPRRHRQAASL